jgi:L-lysine 6-transaminase
MDMTSYSTCENSKGAYLQDAKSGRKSYLDFFTFYASNPLGMNHDRLAGDKDFVSGKSGQTAINKPSNSDIYTEEMADFVDTFSRVGIPDYMPYAFFVSGGALAVENAIEGSIRLESSEKLSKRPYRTEKGHKVLTS